MSDDEYGHIVATRHLGIGVRIDEAPQRAKIAVDFLTTPAAYLRVEGGDIVIADQVVYRITGYDPTDCPLTTELIKNWRPDQKDDPNAGTQP